MWRWSTAKDEGETRMRMTPGSASVVSNVSDIHCFFSIFSISFPCGCPIADRARARLTRCRPGMDPDPAAFPFPQPPVSQAPDSAAFPLPSTSCRPPQLAGHSTASDLAAQHQFDCSLILLV